MSFNIRVYGLLIEKGQILLSDEKRFGKKFTKFPGGGLIQGEGIKDCLKREFKEELSIDIEIVELFYLTDFYQESAFNKNDQIISVYYVVKNNTNLKVNTSKKPFDFRSDNQGESFRWISLDEINENDVTFPIDKLVVKRLS